MGTARSRGSTRREFLKTAGGLALGVAGGSFLSGCLPTSYQTHEAAIVGSGFGGAVAALRLAQAGIETVVLERGKRWPVAPPFNTFPSMNNPDKRSAWLSNSTTFPGLPFRVFSKYTGLIEQVKGDGMDVVVGAGVGGSSLVFGGMMLQPTQALFQQVFPPQVSYAEMAGVYYPMVKSILGLGKIPDSILETSRYLSTRVFLQHAQKAGLNGQKIDDAVNWNVVQQELNGTVPKSASIGESIFGMNSGAKNSVDRNYLALAEATPFVTVAPLHWVQSIAQSNGGYTVSCIRIDPQGNPVEKVEIGCTYLFLAGGSMGTSRLLMKARATGTLPYLNSEIGKHWGNNGDRQFLRIVWEKTGAPQGGPACAAIFHHDNPIAPVTFEHGPAPITVDLHHMAMLGMGIPEKSGYFTYDASSDSAKLHWPTDGDAKAIQAMKKTLATLKSASTTLFTIDMNQFHRFTYHPLGGAVLGKACDYFGRVFGHPHLYVVDASLIPGSTACCNPAWTVAALAERCMQNIVENDL